ncbi:LuxR C-terminal-related transcriptional regulator [Saccharospirillum mangrovi]|uniref:LuxR C-terminal-related transcriptional regulator n=1 Tax=Saccharospirillum mangrovi TaxID=2161747 RepID=UPI000D38ADD5|nr:LuxR C-terminal-related transcriptional regulator [Saccharospirillum mangrovi]
MTDALHPWIAPYKLVPPAQGVTLLPREALLQSLDQCQRFPVTLLHAPAGFGKTSLVSAWLAERDSDALWYSLDPADNDPNYFAAHFIHGLHQASDNGCPVSEALVRRGRVDRLDQLLAKAMAELAQRTQPLCIVLDGAQLLLDTTVLNALRLWLRSLPPTVHLILTSHQEPALGLSALRVRGQLLELGSEQLAFGRDELAALLRDRLNFKVADATLNTLLADTGGWPAGLALVCHSARSEADLLDAGRVLNAAGPHLETYLQQDVLDELPAAQRDFLSHVCVFDRFDAALCDRLLGQTSSQSLIDQLRHDGLFIVALNGRHGGYRLPPLIRQTLMRLTQQASPSEWRERCIAAAYACLDLGQTMQAAQLAVAQFNAELNRAVLHAAGMELYRSGQFQLVERLLAPLDAAQLGQDAPLLLLKSWIWLLSYREEEVLPLLQQAADTRPEYAVARAQVAINREDFDAAQQLASEALAELGDQGGVARILATSVLGQAALCAGELALAQQHLQAADRLARDGQYTQQQLWLRCLLADVHSVSGDLDAALAVQDDALQLARERCVEPLLHLEFLLRGRIQILTERGRWDEALHALETASDLIEPLGDYGLLNPLVLRGRLALARGRDSDLQPLVLQVRRLLNQHPYHSDWVAQAQTFLLAAEHRLSLPAEPLPPARHDSGGPPRNHFQHQLARNAAMQRWLNGEQKTALKQIRQLAQQAAKQPLRWPELHARLLSAVWADDAQAQADWQLVLPWLPAVRPLASLDLYRQLFSVDARDWSDWSLWWRLPPKPAHGASAVHGDPRLKQLNRAWVHGHEQVSPKEFEVLMLLGQGLTNDAIGQCLHVAPSTIKSHIRRLYRKLDVTDRAEARALVEKLLEGSSAQ